MHLLSLYILLLLTTACGELPHGSSLHTASEDSILDQSKLTNPVNGSVHVIGRSYSYSDKASVSFRYKTLSYRPDLIGVFRVYVKDKGSIELNMFDVGYFLIGGSEGLKESLNNNVSDPSDVLANIFAETEKFIKEFNSIERKESRDGGWKGEIKSNHPFAKLIDKVYENTPQNWKPYPRRKFKNEMFRTKIHQEKHEIQFDHIKNWSGRGGGPSPAPTTEIRNKEIKSRSELPSFIVYTLAREQAKHYREEYKLKKLENSRLLDEKTSSWSERPNYGPENPYGDSLYRHSKTIRKTFARTIIHYSGDEVLRIPLDLE